MGIVEVEGDPGLDSLCRGAQNVVMRISSQPRMQRSHRMQAS
jgi:hypothetical protein